MEKAIKNRHKRTNPRKNEISSTKIGRNRLVVVTFALQKLHIKRRYHE